MWLKKGKRLGINSGYSFSSSGSGVLPEMPLLFLVGCFLALVLQHLEHYFCNMLDVRCVKLDS